MTDIKNQQPQNYNILGWDRHIQNMLVLNLFVSTPSSPYPYSGVTALNENKL